ncbi:hypothetical protein THAOC_36673 [Thalassiosira oceanica]|uniref:Uncharacterized protein n=1 Tax=Thalassiosira oceanica TaxID=159749 RepID=K0R1I5_THAOC|nr:hypothetical protein THAOC_36673 [Thalassiosira oceanica]|eukprot:EJK44759.1 hypothetical protein THAOC_36673 [Thalassiosira oceanica]
MEADDRTGRTGEGVVALPAEVWARVLNYCSFSDILASSVAETMILKEALPLITEITIDCAPEMNLTVANRFRDVTAININSLYSLEEEVDYKDTNVNYETQVRMVPFLSRFPQLERVTFGGKDESGVKIEHYWPLDGHFYESEESFPDEGCKERALALIDSLTIGFKSGGLPRNLQLFGLVCPAYSFDCCLGRSEIEEILKERPGGEEILARKGRFIELLGRGRRYAIKPDDESKVLYVVKYEQQHLQELARVANTTGVDLLKLPCEEVSDTILKSFVDSRGIVPTPEQCHLSALSVESLINELKLPVVVAKLQNQPPSQQFEEHYAFVVKQIQLENSEFEDITVDCLVMLREVMTVPPSPDDQASTAILVKSLVTLLDRGSDYVEQAAGVLQVVLAGSQTNINTAVEQGLIKKCVQKIPSSNMVLKKSSLALLATVLTQNQPDHVKALADDESVQKLVQALDSSNSHEIISNAAMILNSIASVDKADELASSIRMNKSAIMSKIRSVMLLDKCKAQSIPDLFTLLKRLCEDSLAKSSILITYEVLPQLVRFLEPTNNCAMVCQSVIDMIGMVLQGSYSQKLLELEVIPPLIRHMNSGDYLQGVIDAGAMHTLMKVLFKTSTHHASQSLRLKAACDLLCALLDGMALADPLATNVCTSLLPKLLANDDESIRNTACKCLRTILQGLSSGDVTKVVKSEILRPCLKMTKKGNEDAAESLHLFVRTKTDVCIELLATKQAIASLVACITSKSSRKATRFACLTLGRVMDGREKVISIAIDALIVKAVLPTLKDEENGKFVGWLLSKIAAGSDGQILHLSTVDGCIEALCDVLTSNTEASSWVPFILGQVLDRKKPRRIQLKRSIQQKLNELAGEEAAAVQVNARIGETEAKIAWLEYHRETEASKSLAQGLTAFKDHSSALQKHLSSFEEKLATIPSMSAVSV